MITSQANSSRSAGTRNLLKEYTRLLQSYVEGKRQPALRRAYALGRKLANGGGVLKLATIHQRAMVNFLLRPKPPAESAEEAAETVGMLCAACPAWYRNPNGRKDARALEAFFTKSLSAFAEKHEGLVKANTQLRRLNEVREQEAKRIAHALHNEAAQLLAAVHLAVEDVARDLEVPERERLHAVRGLLNQIEEELRRLSHELCPTILHDLGLPPALELLAKGVSRRSGLNICLESRSNGRMPIIVETALYRVVQEALNNVAKHAHATKVIIRFQSNGSMVTCSVQDDGVGFKVPAVLGKRGARGLGLLGIRERLEALGGTLIITSSPGRGTELLARLPLRRGSRCRSGSFSLTTTRFFAKA